MQQDHKEDLRHTITCWNNYLSAERGHLSMSTPINIRHWRFIWILTIHYI